MSEPVYARCALAWDEIVNDFLDGGPAVPAGFDRWHSAYRGTGRGEVVLDAFPEPWVGPLDPSSCKGVMLGLNPGRADLGFQGRTSTFATEIRTLGSYSAWAASWPYLRDPWETANGRNRFHRSRLAFMRRWTETPDLAESAMVTFDMYPWHSTGVTAAMRPDPAVIREWVLDPIRSLEAPVFAFGAPWLQLLPRLGLTEIDRLGLGGRPYGTEVASRTVHVYDFNGVLLVAEKHTGGAGPPSAIETARLRDALNS